MAAYLAVGMVVALFHMYREKMLAPAKRGNFVLPVAGMIALMWPLILLSMLLNFLNQPRRSKQVGVLDDEAGNSRKSQN